MQDKDKRKKGTVQKHTQNTQSTHGKHKPLRHHGSTRRQLRENATAIHDQKHKHKKNTRNTRNTGLARERYGWRSTENGASQVHALADGDLPEVLVGLATVNACDKCFVFH